MAGKENGGLGTLITVAFLAFLGGRCSVDEPTTPLNEPASFLSQAEPAAFSGIEPDLNEPPQSSANEPARSDQKVNEDISERELLEAEPVDAPPPPPAVLAKPAPIAETKDDGPVYFRNCSHARALGRAPVRAGDPGYSRKLDRDGDGVGCE